MAFKYYGHATAITGKNPDQPTLTTTTIAVPSDDIHAYEIIEEHSFNTILDLDIPQSCFDTFNKMAAAIIGVHQLQKQSMQEAGLDYSPYAITFGDIVGSHYNFNKLIHVLNYSDSHSSKSISPDLYAALSNAFKNGAFVKGVFDTTGRSIRSEKQSPPVPIETLLRELKNEIDNKDFSRFNALEECATAFAKSKMGQFFQAKTQTPRFVLLPETKNDLFPDNPCPINSFLAWDKRLAEVFRVAAKEKIGQLWATKGRNRKHNVYCKPVGEAQSRFLVDPLRGMIWDWLDCMNNDLTQEQFCLEIDRQKKTKILQSLDALQAISGLEA